MKKAPEKVDVPEQNDQHIDIKNKPVDMGTPLHQKVYNYYKANGLWLTCRKILLRLLMF